MRFLVTILAFVLPLSVFAHAFGVSHETHVDNMHLDIGYSSAAPVVGESVIFDFNLPADEADEVYTDVWVRVDNEKGGTVLATAVYNATFGGPRMSYVFPEAGTYTVSVRYENEGEAVVKTDWPITVVPNTTRSSFPNLPWFIWCLAGLLLGAGGAYTLARQKTSSAL